MRQWITYWINPDNLRAKGSPAPSNQTLNNLYVSGALMVPECWREATNSNTPHWTPARVRYHRSYIHSESGMETLAAVPQPTINYGLLYKKVSTKQLKLLLDWYGDEYYPDWVDVETGNLQTSQAQAIKHHSKFDAKRSNHKWTLAWFLAHSRQLTRTDLVHSMPPLTQMSADL